MPSFEKTADCADYFGGVTGKIRVEVPEGSVEVSDKPVKVDDAALAASLTQVPYLQIVEEAAAPAPKEEK